MNFPILDFLKEWWDRYQAQRKSDALYNKLHRYHKDGKPAKFKQKDAIKMARDAMRDKRKKDLEMQEEKKAMEKK